jgi:hypothetical protein
VFNEMIHAMDPCGVRTDISAWIEVRAPSIWAQASTMASHRGRCRRRAERGRDALNSCSVNSFSRPL